jgi:hypothetical protein
VFEVVIVVGQPIESGERGTAPRCRDDFGPTFGVLEAPAIGCGDERSRLGVEAAFRSPQLLERGREELELAALVVAIRVETDGDAVVPNAGGAFGDLERSPREVGLPARAVDLELNLSTCAADESEPSGDRSVACPR